MSKSNSLNGYFVDYVKPDGSTGGFYSRSFKGVSNYCKVLPTGTFVAVDFFPDGCNRRRERFGVSKKSDGTHFMSRRKSFVSRCYWNTDAAYRIREASIYD